MKDLFAQFRDHSEHLVVHPHPRAWNRIEAKLNAQRSAYKLRQTRFFGLAAVILCVIGLAAGLVLYSQWQQDTQAMQYSQSMEDLHSTASTDESIYDLSRITGYHVMTGGRMQ